MMDKKCYLWIFNNISKYSFDVDTISIKEFIGRLLITEDSINSPEIIQKMESYYEQLVSNFYNNVIGYQNGLADKKITASELDCYFISTSDGMVPIGYYRMVRPAEAAAIIQKYLDICKNNISTEKNKLVSKWQKNVDEISGKFSTIKDSKNPNLLKAVVNGLISVVLFAIAIITFIRMNIVAFIANFNNPDIIADISNRIPALSTGSSSVIFTLIVVLFIVMAFAAYLALLSKKEFALIKDKKTTIEVMNGILNYVTNLEQGISSYLSNSLEPIYSAARQGANISVSENSNANTTAIINKKIGTAIRFVNKNESERTGINNVIMVVAIIVTLLLPLIYTNAIPAMIASMETQNSQSQSSSNYTNSSDNSYDYSSNETNYDDNAKVTFDVDDEYIFPSDRVYLTTEMLDELSKDELALLRNEIYARHGYVFNLEEYKTYFNRKSWYRPNEYFDESMFNAIEKANKDLIVEYEIEKGWR